MNNYFTHFIIEKFYLWVIILDMVQILSLYYISVLLKANYGDLPYNYSVKSRTHYQTELNHLTNQIVEFFSDLILCKELILYLYYVSV